MKKFFRNLGIGLVGLVVVFGLVYALLPKGPRDPMQYNALTKTEKTLFVGDEYAAVTGTPWATQAALDVLAGGGTACDAAVSALLTLNVTHGEAASFPGVAPLIYYNAQSGQVKSYIGAGKAPMAASIEKFTARGYKTVPTMDIYAQLVPASPDVLTALLQECGTLPFSELAAPAIRLAREGFPTHAIMVRNLNFSLIERIGFSILLPYNAQVYIKSEWWRPVQLYDRFTQPDLAETLQALADAADRAPDSLGGYQAVRETFYKGPIAEKIVALHEQKGGLMTAADLATYSGGWETPVSGSYGPYTFYGNGTWSQGVVEPMVLQILEGLDLKSLGHNSPAYIHTVSQATELVFADREAYLGDSDFVDVPLETLLSKEYALQRRRLMTDSAFGLLPPPGQITGYTPYIAPQGAGSLPQPKLPKRFAVDIQAGQDTSQLAILDSYGNSVVITPSDFPQTPMVPGTGLNLGNRMNQFRLEPAHPNALKPGKRPRITPHSLIVFKDGQYFMSISTPGGDMQAQALVQVFLNLVVFEMDIQQAISAPRFYSISAPSSFAPHEFTPGGLRLEASLYDQAGQGLQNIGYTTERDPDWDKDYGAVGAILIGADGHIYAGADPREETLAGGR
ncbi:MAG: gamma-glutamyltransferase [Anaerolineales bacterium]|jgi:gamma-glutamyltranspeptidase/glutathione hydrolase|nr:gamma-glutamyltransferase [Anaerolineales bacterium]